MSRRPGSRPGSKTSDAPWKEVVAAGQRLTHRMNNDLTAAYGVLELLAADPASPADLHPMIVGALTRLDGLITESHEFQVLLHRAEQYCKG